MLVLGCQDPGILCYTTGGGVMTLTENGLDSGRVRFPVCVVDDDAAFRSEIADSLSAIADDVRVFATADAFLAIAAETQPAVILLDLQMPGINGLDLLGISRERGYHHAVAVLSANDSVARAIEAMRLGADDYIQKPVTRRQLLEAVRSLARLTEAKAQFRDDAQTCEMLVRRLSLRERAVLCALSQGFQNKAIAEHLQISARTVEMHRARMMNKLRVRTASEAVQVAIRGGLMGRSLPGELQAAAAA